jgi:hypothetical protein
MSQDLEAWKRFIPTLNQRPTQAPLDRDQQQKAFENLKHMYLAAPPPPPQVFPVAPQKEQALSERQSLEAMKTQLQERGMPQEIQAEVSKKLEENHTAQTIKQFYCTHKWQQVKAQFGILPVKYRICSICGIVK